MTRELKQVSWKSDQRNNRKSFLFPINAELILAAGSKVFFIVMGILVISACNSREEKGRLEPLTNESLFSSIQRTIIEPKCISCHAGAGAAQGIDLSSYGKVMESKSVVPYKPEESKFFTTIESGKMPKGGPRLSDSEIQRVHEWITKGAPEGAPLEPTPPPVPQPTLVSIQKDYVDKRCVSCHQEATHANRHVKLTSLVEVTEGSGPSGHVRKLIKPGCPKQSFFLSIMKEGKMPPPPAEKTPPEWRKVIEDWITSLNPNAGPTCDDEPGGDDNNDEPNHFNDSGSGS